MKNVLIKDPRHIGIKILILFLQFQNRKIQSKTLKTERKKDLKLNLIHFSTMIKIILNNNYKFIDKIKINLSPLLSKIKNIHF